MSDSPGERARRTLPLLVRSRWSYSSFSTSHNLTLGEERQLPSNLAMMFLMRVVTLVSMVSGIKTIDSTSNLCPAKRLAVYQLQLHTFWSEQVTGFEDDIHFYEVIRDQSYLAILNIGILNLSLFHRLIWRRSRWTLSSTTDSVGPNLAFSSKPFWRPPPAHQGSPKRN